MTGTDWVRPVLIAVFGLRGIDRRQRRLLAEIDALERGLAPSRRGAIDDLTDARG